MEIVIRNKVRPTLKTGVTRDSLVNAIQRGLRLATFSFGDYGHGIVSHDHKTIRVYNLQKVRPKKKQSQTASYQNEDGKTIRKTKIEHAGHWNAYVYDFNIEMLKHAGLTVHQGSRTFHIVDKNGKKMSVREYKLFNR